MNHPFQKEFLVAEKLARSAGGVAKALQSKAAFSFKEDGSGPVSEADLKADEIIREGLSLAFPNDVIITEESSQNVHVLPKAERIWLVDPIDGTVDYVRGGPNYSVMIGLLIDNTPAFGVIFEPETGSLWVGCLWSENGTGKHFAEVSRPGVAPKSLSLDDTAVNKPIVAASKSHPSKLADKVVSLLDPAQIIKMGSIGLKLGLISEGKADLYVAASRRIKVWDTCAPFALLKAAGGFAYTLHGNSVSYGPALNHGTPFIAVSRGFAPTILRRLSDPDFDFVKEL